MIFSIKGGNNWDIQYVCTIEERIDEENKFGEKVLFRRRGGARYVLPLRS